MEQAIRQRLRFELAGLECRDLEQQSAGGARLLLQQELRSGGHVKSALQELLSGGSGRYPAEVVRLSRLNTEALTPSNLCRVGNMLQTCCQAPVAASRILHPEVHQQGTAASAAALLDKAGEPAAHIMDKRREISTCIRLQQQQQLQHAGMLPSCA
jgi:hypothetical protein